MTLLWRILKLYAPEKGWLLLGIALGALTAISSVVLLSLSGWFIAAMGIAGVTGVAINYFTPAAIIRALAITRTVGRYGERMLTHKAALRVTAHTRNWLYSHIERLPANRLMGLHSGDLFSRLRGDIEVMEKFYLGAIVPFAVALLSVPPVLVYLAMRLPLLAVVLAFAVLVVGLVLPFWVERRSQRAQHDIATLTYDMRSTVSESWQAAAELMVYGQDQHCCSDLCKMSQQITKAQTNQQNIVLAGQGISSFVTALIGPAALLVIAAPAAFFTLPPPHIAALPLLCIACLDVVAPLAPAVHVWHGVRLAARRIFDLVDNVPPASGRIVPNAPFRLAARDVNFGYDRARPVLRNVGFDLAAGQSLAIMGPSGFGKSTLAALVTGLYAPDSGEVLVNDVSSIAADEESWRRQFGVAEQRTHVFAGTLRRNLLIADPLASDEQLLDACALAGLDRDIGAMPKGLDTFLGELGIGLSGGQIRRLALARALLKKAPCLILDEPTDGLDAQMGISVVTNILVHARRKNMAVIIITHDPAIAALCEQRFDIGRI